MFVLVAEFLFETFRADPDGVASTGRAENCEWPPSPARLFGALVDADGTGDRCRVTDGSELEEMEQWPAPTIYFAPDVHHQKLESRFVVRQSGSADKSTHQEYVARTGALVRPGVRAALRRPTVVYVWPVDPAPSVRTALARRAARVGYLGCSDSPARLRLGDELPGSLDGLVPMNPTADGPTLVGVPRPGRLAVLDAAYEAFRTHGPSVTRAQFPALRTMERYGMPGQLAEMESDRGEVVAWLLLSRSIQGRRISAVTGALKAAVLSQYQRLVGEPPPVLHGHGLGDGGYDTSRFLALPNVGGRHSDGRIHGLAVWMPPGTDEDLRARVRDAAVTIRKLHGRGFERSVEPWQGQPNPWSAHPRRWTGPARVWATAFPAVHERHGRSIDHAELSRWCTHAGLPEPAHAEWMRTPFIRGAVDLAPVEVNRPGRRGRPYSHVRLVFDDPITGPLVIGGARQRGLGLLAPIEDSEGLGPTTGGERNA